MRNETMRTPMSGCKRCTDVARLTFTAIFLLMSVLSFAVYAQEFNYTTNAGSITITGYTGAGGDVVIPETVNGLPVSTIGYEAFYAEESLTSVIIPNGVKDIGESAFQYCSSLGSVTIPNSVTNIGLQAFCNCTSLRNVTIPDSVTSLGGGVFSGCDGLGSVTIPDSISNIAPAAFESCASLTNISIPTTINDIGQNAFLYCTSLASVTIPNSVTNIGLEAFTYCNSLTGIFVDAANPSYCDVDGVLFNKKRTTLIQCPGGKTGTFTIPNGVTSIVNWAFASCARLKSVTIPETVRTVGGAFIGCTSLTSVAIPNSVIAIRNWTFNNCTSLTNITIGNSVTNIGNYALIGCTNLSSVYFGGNAPTVGGSLVFYRIDNVTVYYLPGTTGWGSTFAGRPTVLWNPTPQITVPADPFGFTITGSSNLVIVVEAATSLTSPDWTAVSTNTLTDGSSPFSDPQSANRPTRFYRLRSP